jgi:hypothetical protein
VPATATKSSFFVNMEEDCYWCQQPTFVDLVKAAECFRSGWTACANGHSAFATDSAGWPLVTPAGDVARALLGPVHRTGTYVVRWEGKGSFAIASVPSDGQPAALASKVTFEATASGSATFVAVNQGAIALEISATAAADHLRNFSVIHQDLVQQAECDPFYPELESYLKDFAGFRMMDWTLTNGSEQINWSDHVPAYGFRQANRYETALQLCNRVHRDCWLNVPHKASDDYVAQLAALVRDTLDPTLKAYIEYSNETWNGQFPQAQYVIEQGVAHNLPGESTYTQGARFHAYRAKQIFAIFDSAFGSSARSRLVRVLAGQTGSTWLAGEHIDQIGGTGEFDAYATAPYIGPGSVDGFGGAADSWSLDDLFNHLSNVALPSAIADMNSVAKTLASYAHPVAFVAYEGGQHLAGPNASDHARALYEQAQTDQRMYDLFQRYFDAWKASGGRTFSYFNALGPISGQYGSWGMKPRLDTPEAQAPKYRAFKTWSSANPKWW